MPFKSKAHARKFRELVRDGKISEETYQAWADETDWNKLPERKHKKKKRRTKHGKRKSKTRRTFTRRSWRKTQRP